MKEGKEGREVVGKSESNCAECRKNYRREMDEELEENETRTETKSEGEEDRRRPATT